MASSNQSPKPASQQPTNPWEVSVSEESTASSPSFPRPVTVEFNGTLDAKQIRKFYHNPTQFGCLLPLVLLSAFIWGFPFYMLVGIAGPLIAAIIALLVILGMYRKLLGTGKVEKLIRIRPWLIGQTHGVVSGGRWTVWHNDFCMQTTTRSFMDDPGSGMLVYPSPSSPSPLAMVPSTCFFESSWRDLLHDYLTNRTYTPLIAEAPPADAWVSMLSPTKSLSLMDRYRAIHWRPSSHILLVVLVFGVWATLFEQFPSSSMPFWAISALALVPWILLEATRFTRAKLLAKWEFQDPQRAPYRKSIHALHGRNQLTDAAWPEIRWFNQDTLFVSDFQHWMRIPTRYVESVLVEPNYITFRLHDLKMVFHREGFEDESHWQAACNTARSLAATND